MGRQDGTAATTSDKARDWNEIEIVVKDTSARCPYNGEVLEPCLIPAPWGWKGIAAG